MQRNRSIRVALAILLSGFLSSALAAEKRPSVLFYGPISNARITKPLVAMGVDVDVCGSGQLPQRLADGKYNVVVVGDFEKRAQTGGAADRKALVDFLAKGGGVFVCKPSGYPYDSDWDAANEWLSSLGARPRWELLQEGSSSNVLTDGLRVSFSWSDDIAPHVKAGAKGVLTMLCDHSGGLEPSQSYDLSPDWTVLVRGRASMKTAPDKRNEESLQKWMPKNVISNAPPLLASRQVGQGRLAVFCLPYCWSFGEYPEACPSIDSMMTKGLKDKPSDWLRVCANTFLWLAEPSLKAGLGGAGTPAALLNPPFKAWETPDLYAWSNSGPIEASPQMTGLIGARTALSSGRGTVAEYVAAAKAAKLSFLVFLEDSMKMDQAKWDQLVKGCNEATSGDFAAIPGLTYEDAQGNHLYAFADEVRFPKPDMLLPDRRLATTNTMRSKVYFDYVNELMKQICISGFWRHKENFLPPVDYKLYNSFPIYSAEDGKPVDSALDDFLYLQGIGGCQMTLAFEFMSSPAQVAKRARDGWRVVWMRSLKDMLGTYHRGAYSFSGMGSQYITQGPEILAWKAVRNMTESHGLWWRPDLAEFRMQLKVASDAGLKSVEIRDADRVVMRRWLPGGAKSFEQELVMAEGQQFGLLLMTEDVKGRKAVSMAYWNRNLLTQEYICSDRCNFLGDARLRTKEGEQVWTPAGFKNLMGVTPSKGSLDMSVHPAVSLTYPIPTLPIDGQPGGTSCMLNFGLQVPGEYRYLFSYPTMYVIGPEMAVGQGNYRLAYDPADTGADRSPLGHAYGKPYMDCGNAWSSWHKLVPTRTLSGWSRTYAAVARPPDGFRLGWHETDVTLKDAVMVDVTNGFQVMYPDMGGWIFYRDGKVEAEPNGTNRPFAPFERGLFGIQRHVGGNVLLIPMSGPLQYRYLGNGGFSLAYRPLKSPMAAGDRIHFEVGFAGVRGEVSAEKMLAYAANMGVAKPGTVGYAPKLSRGKQLDNYLVWRLDGKEGNGIEAKIPKVDLLGRLTVTVEGLNDNWSVQLLDRAKKIAPPEVTGNTRGLPIRDGRCFAQLDLAEGDSDLFIGHPVTADKAEVKLLVAWRSPGVWQVEAHNPGDKPVKVQLKTNPGWTVFAFAETAELPAGSSQTWQVKEL
jgi:hypothetical protein